MNYKLSRMAPASLLVLAIGLGIIIGLNSLTLLALFPNQAIALLVVLGAPIGLLFILAALKFSKLFVLFLILYTPVELLVQKWLPDSMATISRYGAEAILFAVFGVLFLHRVWMVSKPWKRTPIDIPLIAFLTVGILSAIVNQTPPIVAGLGFRILLRYVLLFYLIIQLDFDRQAIKQMVRGMIGIASLVVVIGLLQAVIGPPMTQVLRIPDLSIGDTMVRSISGVYTAHGRYIFSTLGRYDALGGYCVVVLLLLLALYINYPRRRILLGGLILMTGLCLALTFSRQSWIALYIALLAWIPLIRNKWSLRLLLPLALLPLFVVLLAFSFPHLIQYYRVHELEQVSFSARILELLSPAYFSTVLYSGGRLFIIRFVGERILQLAPFLGFGPGRFGSLTADYFGYGVADLLGMQPGSVRLVNDVNWITVLGQYGLIGTLFFLFMFLALLFRMRKIYRRSPDPLVKTLALTSFGSLIAILSLAFFGPNFEQRIIAMHVWLIAGLAITSFRNVLPARSIPRHENSHRQ